jgi:hypothetical protein
MFILPYRGEFCPAECGVVCEHVFNSYSGQDGGPRVMQQYEARKKLMTEPTYEELKARLAELEAQKQRTGNMSFKVSDKGGVSVYGLGRFPVTLYYEQWPKLLDRAQDLRDFLEENKSKLKLKE